MWVRGPGGQGARGLSAVGSEFCKTQGSRDSRGGCSQLYMRYPIGALGGGCWDWCAPVKHEPRARLVRWLCGVVAPLASGQWLRTDAGCLVNAGSEAQPAPLGV